MIWTFFIVLLMTFLRATVGVVDVFCGFESQQKKLECECISQSATNYWEDLYDIIYQRLPQAGLDFAIVSLVNCRSIKISVDMVSLSTLSSQRVTYVNFELIDNLELYITNIPPGSEPITFVTDTIGFLELSGKMYELSATLRFFLRNNPNAPGDIAFNQFYATTPISLINVQDANNVKVVDSTFQTVIEVDFFRVGRCENYYGTISCNKVDLFINSWAWLEPKYIILIVSIILLIIAIAVGVGIGCYVVKWRKKNDLELLGYPPKVPPPRSNLSSTSIR